ncbi:MAG: hypothetical protein ACRDPW_02750 [Mycobacteriales bacterium]
MSRRKAMALLSTVSGEQWGMVAAGQARRLGVSRVDLNHLVGDGTLEPIPGAARVYRLTGAPADPELDPLRAAWLQLGGSKTWGERTADPDAVVSHRSAAHARSLGDLIPLMHEFYVSTRHRLRREDVRLRVRSRMEKGTWTVWSGLPVCTIEVIVSDLLHDHEDESAIAQIVQDAMRDGLLNSAGLQRAVRGGTRGYGHVRPARLMAALHGKD